MDIEDAAMQVLDLILDNADLQAFVNEKAIESCNPNPSWSQEYMLSDTFEHDVRYSEYWATVSLIWQRILALTAFNMSSIGGWDKSREALSKSLRDAAQDNLSHDDGNPHENGGMAHKGCEECQRMTARLRAEMAVEEPKKMIVTETTKTFELSLDAVREALREAYGR